MVSQGPRRHPLGQTGGRSSRFTSEGRFELAGDLDAAVESAQRAVRYDTTDDRRLFLARLRLRRGEPDLAAQGLSRLRGRSARARGEVMLALDTLRRGDRAGARSRLLTVRRRPWSAPAAVIAAGLALADKEYAVVVDLLDRVTPCSRCLLGRTGAGDHDRIAAGSRRSVAPHTIRRGRGSRGVGFVAGPGPVGGSGARSATSR